MHIFTIILFANSFEKGYEAYKKNLYKKAENIWKECSLKESDNDLRCTYSLAILYNKILNEKVDKKEDLEKYFFKKNFYHYNLIDLYKKNS